MSDDGTQTFSCRIPKFYINPHTNFKELNPRWGATEDGTLAENIRILKVFVQVENETRIYPFLINTITDNRDSNFAVYRSVEASGLAFAELGKIGYKIELNQTLVETEQKALDENEETKGQIIETTMDYWLQKVFPCETDSSGKITSWLTPWCYEVRMDWSYYSENRESTKVYEDGYVSSWKYNNAAGNKADLVPASYEPSKEKQRLIDVKNSNKYNISQTIAETFEVFCRYEYKCDENGHFIREYTDANGNVWTGRKVIFYNKAIKQENPLVVDYQKNLQTIKRSSDSTDVYTKLYVTPLEAEEMSDGYVTIANTAANPLYDEFILNFDYMDKQGALTDFQKEVIKEYEYKIREANLGLEVALEQLEQARVARNDVEAEQAFYDKSSSEAEEQYKYYSDLANNEITNTPVVKNSKNTYPVIFFEDGKDTDIYKARLDLHGIDITGVAPFEGYNNKECEESKDSQGHPVDPIFELGKNCIFSKTVPTTLESIGENVVIFTNEYGYPSALYCNGTSETGKAILNDEDGYIYLHLHYCPKNEYEDIRDAFARILEDNNTRQDALLTEYTIYDNAYNKALEESNKLLAIKEEQNRRLERILGPALREGYWTPDDYSGSTETKIETVSNLGPVSWTFDTEPLVDEWEGSFQLGANLDPIPYPYLDYRQDLDFTTYAPDDLVLYLNKIAISDPITKSNEIGWYSIQINFVDWYVKFEKAYPVGTKYKITFVNGKPKFWIGEPNTDWKQVANEYWTPEKPKELGTNAVPPVAWHSDDTDTSISTIESQQTLYYRSHFNYCYINHNGAITPIILIHTNAEGDNFSLEEGVAYDVSYGFREVAAEPTDYGILEYRAAAKIVYPRLKINEKNVQAKSTLFMITKDIAASEEGITLDRYYDYNIIIRDSYPLITLKIGDKILPTDIYKNHFTFKYGISRANEQLYLDAKDVAYDNSYPRYTYDLTIANLPGVFQIIDLGQLIYINDHAVGIHAATGYVSEVTLKLDQPQNDSVKVQNYKTKFEDLFNTIVAQSEAMKTNKHAYDIAASVFTQPGAIGQISGSILQTALNNNSFWLSWSATGVEITNEQGIILTNKRPYANGVYGQVILQGGGIFLSSSVDANGNRIWSAAITPDGINASLMTAGQLNTERVLVYAGENMAFQWNGEGIFAYRRETDKPKENEYVRFSQNGLHYRRPKMEKSFDQDGNEIWEAIEPEELIDVVALDWDGLTLTKNNGVKTFQIDRHTGDLTLSGTMKSANYIEGASRILNTGWKINQDGYAEFNDLFVRGTISASVFEYEETSAIGGRMFVTPTIILKSDFTKTATIKQIDGTDGNLQITVNTGVKVDEKGRITIGGKTWQKNDVVLFNGSFIQQQSFAVENEGIEYPIFEIKSLQMKITDLQNERMTLTSIANINEGTTVQGVFFDRNGNGKTLADVIAELKPPADINDLRGTGDWHLLSFSRDGQQEGILLTAIEPNSSAYIDILGKGTDDITGSTRVRLGDLSALTNNTELNKLGIKPEGWGLFADNVYLRGLIQAIQGQIGGWTISEGELSSGTDENAVHLSSINEYAFWAGGDTPTDASFKVSRKGILEATGAKITGEIIATSLYIGDKDIEDYLNNTLDPLIDKIDGKTTTYYSEKEPTNPEKNDIWYNTSAGTIGKYNGTDWDDITEESLKAALDAANIAQATADGKIVTYAQPDEPQVDATEGDLWIDTDDNNKLYRWNSTANKWESVRDQGIEEAQKAASDAINSAKDAYEFAQKINNGEAGIFFQGSNVASVQLNTDVGGLIITGKNGSYFKATNDAFGFFEADGTGLLYADNGNLWLKGYISAKGGSIGGWNIDDSKLYSTTNENIYLRGNPSNETGPDVIHIEDQFRIDLNGNVQASGMTIGNTVVNINGITIDDKNVPTIIINEEAPVAPAAGSVPGSVLWLKPATGSSGDVIILDTFTLYYSTSAGGSGQYYNWTNSRKNLRISGTVTDYGTTTGRARRGGYFTFDKKLPAGKTYEYTLTVPMALGSTYNNMPPGAKVHVALTTENLKNRTELNQANASYYSILDSGPLGVAFQPQNLVSGASTTMSFSVTSSVNLSELSQPIYFEVWTTALDGYYISNVFNSKNGGNVTLKCTVKN